MSNVFYNVRVRPHWGAQQVVVSWEVSKELFHGNFIVFRSFDGITGFVEVASGAGLDHIVDTVVPQDRITEYFYRITLQHKGKRYDSDVVSTYGDVPRLVFGMSHQIMKLEYLRMRRCHEIKIFRQKLAGPVCPVCTDPDTQQKIGSTLCETCFGTGITGGFEEGVDSHFLLVGNSKSEIQDTQDGAGSNDPHDDQARILPYPPLRKGDMLVNKSNDVRWLVNTLTYYSVNDMVPCIYDADLQHLRRNDVRYKVGITK